MRLFFCMMSVSVPVDFYANTCSLNIPCEVKFPLDEKVLDSDNKTKVSDIYKDIFALSKEILIKVSYIDTDEQFFFKESWINRIRAKEGSKDFEYTFKKRYSITDEKIDEAVERAKADGIFGNKDFSFEIDWSFARMTLDCKFERDVSNRGFGSLEFPPFFDVIKTIKRIMPNQEMNEKEEKWGDKILGQAKLIGPVLIRRYKGKFCGKKITFEVWPIENQRTKEICYIAELSFDSESVDEAKEDRKMIMEKLSEMKVLKQEGEFKTNLIFEAYKK